MARNLEVATPTLTLYPPKLNGVPLNASRRVASTLRRTVAVHFSLDAYTHSNNSGTATDAQHEAANIWLEREIHYDMPHSVSPESEAPEVPDATMEEDGVANSPAQQPAEDDVDMADAAPSESLQVADQSNEEKTADDSSKEEKKEDVKLEDLFADADSDDEFPSSRPAEEAQSSSAGELTPTSR